MSGFAVFFYSVAHNGADNCERKSRLLSQYG